MSFVSEMSMSAINTEGGSQKMRTCLVASAFWIHEVGFSGGYSVFSLVSWTLRGEPGFLVGGGRRLLVGSPHASKMGSLCVSAFAVCMGDW